MIATKATLINLEEIITNTKSTIQKVTIVDEGILQQYIVVPSKKTSIVSFYITLLNKNMGVITLSVK